jgi:hypothetical protein
MRNHKVLKKTGRIRVSFTVLGVLLRSVLCFASDIQFSAQVDESKVALDGTVSLKMLVRSDSNTMAGEPQFQAPDFEVVNEYKSISVESRYDSTSGGLSMQNTQQITKVLRPLKIGALRITGIRLDAGGKAYKAPDVQVQVVANSPGGALRGGGALRRGTSQGQSAQKNVAGASTLVRAEIDKKAAYKGEQIIVSYYLYHRVKIFNIQVEKFPVLSGFLREDLEMPVMGQRLDSEQVVLNGIPYERSLLTRYAAYPLEEGKLSIDSISLRFNYYAGSRNNTFDDEDPFFGFFQQMAPRVGSGQSERLEVEVTPLPQGKSEKFTGGIGEFNVISAVDKYEVRANEAITLSVKVEGRGNIAAIQAPQAKWPANIELYDAKGKSQGGRGGVGEKVFEFLLIPRVPGEITLNPLEFEFFDPIKKQYYIKSTETVKIKVLDPAPGTSLVPVKQTTPQVLKSQDQQQSSQADEMRYLKAPLAELDTGFSLSTVWHLLYWACGLALTFLLGLIGGDLFKGGRKRLDHKRKQRSLQNAKSWEKLTDIARAASNGGSWQETTQAYEILCGIIFDSLDRAYEISSRAISRSELKDILVGDRGMSERSWQRVDQLLEFSDLVRFASTVGGVSEAAARTELEKWVAEGRAVVQLLEKNL